MHGQNVLKEYLIAKTDQNRYPRERIGALAGGVGEVGARK
jgi:hypothetical protein